MRWHLVDPARTTPQERSARFLAALRDGDARRAEEVVSRALRARMGVAQVHDEVIAAALCEVGRLWALGEVSVADEHLATAIVLRVLGTLSGFAVPDGDRGTVLLAAVQDERHVVGPEVVARLLTGAGVPERLPRAEAPRYVPSAQDAVHALTSLVA